MSRLVSLAWRQQTLDVWAAILSHAIAHVVRRHWAPLLIPEALEETGAIGVLGGLGLISGSWTDANKASADMGDFCWQPELEADRDRLMLMARIGYRPD